MKTFEFKVTRAICGFLILLTVLGNIVYFFYFCWNYKIFETERALKYGEKWTLRSFSLYFVYLNILCSFLFGYAFNIGSRYVIKVAVWITLAVNVFGIFASGYAQLYASKALEAAIQSNLFSPVGFNVSISKNYPGENLRNIQKLILSDYSAAIRHFKIFEFVNIGLLSGMCVLGAATRFIGIHREDEETPVIIDATVGNEVESLRPVRTLICVQM